jgi:phosphoserine phosphatase
MHRRRATVFAVLSGLLVASTFASILARASDPLPSWSAGAARSQIVDFVSAVTDPAGPSYVPHPQRIAVFDNDGTLWSEQPFYVQLVFILDRIRTLAPAHPEWQTLQPYQGVLAGDLQAVAEAGERGLVELAMASHAGMTTDEFSALARNWLATARHPALQRRYTDLVYQPMLELLDYLRANGFKTYIVSGGGVEFVRVFAEERYGIPPEQVIGTTIRTRYELRDGEPVVMRLPEVEFIDDKSGKPVAISKFIGQRPIAAFGNSDGDFEMLEWVTAGPGPRLGLIVHHDDAEREFAYDRASSVGKLARGLDEGPGRGWIIASMKEDWKTIYPSPTTISPD